MKENDLVHGEWEEWLDKNLDLSRRHAHRFIKVYEEVDESYVTSGSQLGIKALYEIATLPQEEREKEHTLSSGETKTVDEMTPYQNVQGKRGDYLGALFFGLVFLPLTLFGLAAINIWLFGWDSFKEEIQKESQVTAITHDSIH